MNGYAVQLGLYDALPANATATGNVQFDHFSLTTNPEPASLAFAAMGNTVLLIKSRRRAA